MGCASSKGDINDQHPNIFQVMNVDEQFHAISPGQIEITDTELVFHQRGKLPTKWSLRNLRKYGFDVEIFSFECGRRCATGPGIFAFKCRKAEQLFNLLQHNIQVRNMSEDIPLSELTIAAPSTGGGVQMQRRSGAPEGYLNPVSTTRPTLSRPGSITSNGPTSPTSVSTPSQQLEDNNNKRVSVEHSYLNTDAIHAATDANPQYINVSSEQNADNVQQSHLYMNVDTTISTNKEIVAKESKNGSDINEIVDLPRLNLNPSLPPVEEDPMHCYANIDTSSLTFTHFDGCAEGVNVIGNYHTEEFAIGASVPPTPTITEVNYVELDLPSGKNGSTQVAQPTPESPHKTKSYVTIDFNKTNALSQSIHPRIDIEEGCRKTRHNSTISDVRHSSSISD